MANNENLKKGTATRFKAGEEQAKIASKGGHASVEARRRKKTMREVFDAISENTAPEAIQAQARALGLPIPLTLEEAYAIAMAKEIINGNVGAYRAVAEVRGERVNKQEVEVVSTEQSKLDELLKQRRKRRNESKREV